MLKQIIRNVFSNIKTYFAITFFQRNKQFKRLILFIYSKRTHAIYSWNFKIKMVRVLCLCVFIRVVFYLFSFCLTESEIYISWKFYITLIYWLVHVLTNTNLAVCIFKFPIILSKLEQYTVSWLSSQYP